MTPESINVRDRQSDCHLPDPFSPGANEYEQSGGDRTPSRSLIDTYENAMSFSMTP